MGGFKKIAELGVLFFILVILAFSQMAIMGCELLEWENSVKSSDPYDEDCNLKPEFDNDWIKYSDFDYRIPVSDRSYSAQQYNRVETDLIKIEQNIWELQVAVVIENKRREAMESMKTALVHNMKTNLLKSFWRLTWITYKTIDGGVSNGKSYSKFLTGGYDRGINMAGEAISLAQAYSHKDFTIGLNTSTTEGKVAKVARDGWVSTMKAFKDPTESALALVEMVSSVGGDVVKGASGEILPSADISPEEIAILKTEYIQNKKYDEMIQDSFMAAAQMNFQIMGLESMKEDLIADLVRHAAEEKARVSADLISECKKKTGQDDKENEGKFNWLDFLFN